MFYCLTVITTIGYGFKAPWTETGRLLTIPYAVLGFALLASLIALLNKRLLSHERQLVNKIMVKNQNQSQSRVSDPPNFTDLTTKERQKTFRSPMFFTILTVMWVIIPTLVFIKAENWSFSTAIYFVFVTLTTIGFGDFTPSRVPIFLMEEGGIQKSTTVFETSSTTPQFFSTIQTPTTTTSFNGLRLQRTVIKQSNVSTFNVTNQNDLNFHPLSSPFTWKTNFGACMFICLKN